MKKKNCPSHHSPLGIRKKIIGTLKHISYDPMVYGLYYQINKINTYNESWLQMLLQDQVDSSDWEQLLSKKGSRRNPLNRCLV